MLSILYCTMNLIIAYGMELYNVKESFVVEIKEVIEMGRKAAISCRYNGIYGAYYYKGDSYVEWLSLSTRFLESNFPNDKDTRRFSELASKANGNGDRYYQPLMGILNAFEKIPVKPIKKDIFHLLHDIFTNFHRFDIAMKRRYGKRTTIEINDEHDLQDALFAILRLFTKDIQKETYVPNYAGSNSRVDFFLPEHELIIETKMASPSLQDKSIGEQLVTDFNRYKELTKAKHLVCFIYDKDSNINNPPTLIRDLEKLSDSVLTMSVFISPY